MALKSLKNKIVFIIAGMIVLIGGLTAIGIGLYMKNSILAAKDVELVASTLELAERSEGTMDAKRISVENIAKNKTIRAYLRNNEESLGEVDVARFLSALNVNEGYDFISILNKDGNVIASTEQLYLDKNFSYRKYIKDSIRKSWGVEFALNAITKRPQFFFANSIKDDKGLGFGFVVVGVDAGNVFDKIFVKHDSMLEHDHMLLDANGVVLESNNKNIIYRSIGKFDNKSVVDGDGDNQYGDINITPLQYDEIAAALRNLNDVKTFNFFDKVDGSNEILSIAPVKKYPFTVAMEIKEDDYIGGSVDLYYGMGIFIFIAALLAALVIYFFVGKFLKPLKQLRQAAEMIGKNNFDFNVSIRSGDELEELGEAFNSMIVGIKKAIAEIDQKVKNQTGDIVNKQLEIENQKKAAFNILEDMAEEKENSDKLAFDLEKFKLAIENTNDQVVITNKDGVILYANPAMTKITGYSLETAIGKTPALWGNQMSEQYYKAMWETISIKKMPYEGELYNKRKNGTTFLAHVHISPILNSNGEVKFFVGVVRDISREREAQIHLKKDAEELKSANILIESQKERAESVLAYLQSIGDGVVATDLEGKIIFFNEAAEKLTGASNSEAIGSKAREIVFISEEKDAKVLQDLIGDALGGADVQKKIGEHYLIKSKKGSIAAVSFRLSFIFDKNEKKQGCILVMRDVSEQREIEKTKDDFLSVAAHQLRTPLTGVRWSLEMLMDGDLGELPEAAKDALDQISENNKRLILLVNDLLDVSRINMGKSKEEPVPVDVPSALQESINTLHSLAEERGIKIAFEQKAKEIPMVNIGPKHLFQSFENLLSNAIKYSPIGGDVKVALDFKKGKVVIDVSDNGIGIPKEDQEKIFGKFFRASNAALKETEGSGLGLNVVKSFIEDFGGNVSFVSKEGKGTTFTIELPTDFKS